MMVFYFGQTTSGSAGPLLRFCSPHTDWHPCWQMTWILLLYYTGILLAGGTTHVVESPAVCIVCQISRIVLITRKRSTCVCDRDQNRNQMWSQGQSVSSGNILLKDSGAWHDTEWIRAGNDLSCIKKCREHQEMFEQGVSLSNFGGNRGSSPMLGLHAMYGNVLTLLLFAGSLLSTGWCPTINSSCWVHLFIFFFFRQWIEPDSKCKESEFDHKPKVHSAAVKAILSVTRSSLH